MNLMTIVSMILMNSYTDTLLFVSMATMRRVANPNTRNKSIIMEVVISFYSLFLYFIILFLMVNV